MAAFFNIKPTRRSNPEARTTLDALHTYHISQIKEKSTHIDELKLEFSSIKQKKRECQNPIELSVIEEQEAELQKNITNIESNTEIYDYFLKTVIFYIIITIYRIKFRGVLILPQSVLM